MLTLDALKRFGADTEEGLSRCLNNEPFYLRLVGMALEDSSFEKLGSAIEANDLQAAFEAAHALKGVLGNLSLTPLYTAASELTELLRARADADYRTRYQALIGLRDHLKQADGAAAKEERP